MEFLNEQHPGATPAIVQTARTLEPRVDDPSILLLLGLLDGALAAALIGLFLLVYSFLIEQTTL